MNSNAVPTLGITTGSLLPSAIVGTNYGLTFNASAGTPPYSWSIIGGALPQGLSLNAVSGFLSGIPTAAGSFQFTVQVGDSAPTSATASAQFSINVSMQIPAVNINVTGDINPLGQPVAHVVLADPYPLEITGQMTVVLSPDTITAPNGETDLRFSNGARTIAFAIPANTSGISVPLQVGTVAGTVTFRVASLVAAGNSIISSPPPSHSIRIDRLRPTIISASLTNRTAKQAIFRFTGAAGRNLQTSILTVAVSNGFTSWYQSQSSAIYGSQFLMTQTFNVQGDINAIGSVSVTLTNAQGESDPKTSQ
jgi:hypothetical protein